jgi:NTP pyrophosphatase (non-canonical NTP hydrolase)
MSDFQRIITELQRFRDDRQWAQFHDSKNLALAISIEAAELNELFLWKEGSSIEEIDRARLQEELADVLTFCFLLADKHQFDVEEIILTKIQQNEKKYPIEKARGTPKKYDQL